MILDHIAIAGETLDAARAHVEEALGVRLQPGGEHAAFGTHNALLGLEEGLYLEAIAINPAAPRPDRPRWFDLDRFEGPPRLTNWICRTDRLDHDLLNLPSGMGVPLNLNRGDLKWRMAVPPDGILSFDNCAPALIQWECDIHPVQLLKPSGVRLRRLTIRHPESLNMKLALDAMLRDPRVVFEGGGPGLHAEFDTPHGLREIRG